MAGTLTASIIKNDTTSPPVFQNSAGTEIGTLCRAWVNFNGAGGASIRAQYNVSSVTFNGTGDFTINFTNPLADGNYSILASGNRSTDTSTLGICGNPAAYTPTSSSVRITNKNTNNGSAENTPSCYVAVFR